MYLVQALRPLDRNAVPYRRRDQAKRRVLGQRAMPLPIKIHLPAQLAVPPGILTRHVIGGVGGAEIDGGVAPGGLDEGDEAGAVAGVGGGAEEGLAAGGGEGVAEWGEDQEEEEEDGGEDEGGD